MTHLRFVQCLQDQVNEYCLAIDDALYPGNKPQAMLPLGHDISLMLLSTCKQ